MRAWALFLLAACGSPAAQPTIGNQAAPDDAWLAWTGGESPSTQWLDRDGHEVGRARGVFIAEGASLFRVETRRRTFPLPSCNDILGDDVGQAEGGEGSVTSLALVPVAGDASPIALGDGGVAGEGLAGDDGVTSLVATLGPLLFLESSTDQYACGAHGEHLVTAEIHDLREGLVIADPVDDTDITDDQRIAALAQLSDEAATYGADPLSDDTPELAAIRPRWHSGHIAARYLLWVDTCYACSNGAWSSYTSGAWVDAPAPALFASVAASVPQAVARALDFADGVSWGHATPAWRDVFSARD